MNEMTRENSITVKAAIAITALAFALSFASSISRAEAVEDEKGFYVGLKFVGASLQQDEQSDVFYIKDDGGGLQLDIGYRFNPVFMLEIVAGGSTHDTSDPKIEARITSVQIFGYYRFLPENAFRPYIKGGFGGYGLVLEAGSANVEVDGGGMAFGGGFRYFLSPHFSFGVDFTYNMIQYDKAKLSLGELSYQTDIDENGGLATIGIAFGYSF
jgi:outer membrane protein W